MTKTLLGRVPVVAILAILVAVLATPVSAGGGGISLKGQAGRFDTTTFKALGNSTDAQASWTNKVALDGKFSMFLEKTTDDQFAFAAAVVDGVNGQTVGSLGDLAFSFTGVCNGGSPRFNLYFDSNGDGIADGIVFLGCNNVTLTSAGAPGWQTATFPNALIVAGGVGGSCYDFGPPISACTVSATATVTSLSVLIDIVGSNNIDRVSVNGVTTGEPNGD
ncbi:MAG TPA: hypothetical protein VNY77_07695 [Candidatus Angelobacter sp.]|nr:hypothetical protein [Candidatus Angelobacter sp.]